MHHSLSKLTLAALATPALFGAAAVAQTTTRASVNSQGVQASSYSTLSSISSDGRYVAFESDASDLVPGDTNASADIFVHDMQTGSTERVSIATSGAEGNDRSYSPSISADGRYVAFESYALNLIPGGTTSGQVFVRDRQAGTTVIASVDSAGIQGGSNSLEARPRISGNGRFIVWESSADNLVAGDTNAAEDIFVHDLQSGGTSRVSFDSNGVQGNGNSWMPSISYDGRYVTYWSDATNLVSGDSDGMPDVFVRDRQSGITSRASVSSAGVQENGPSGPGFLFYGCQAISADGRFVVFESAASNLVPNDTNGAIDVFVRDLMNNTTTRASINTSGVESALDARNATISSDGRYVAFRSAASNLVSGDNNGIDDLFVRDLVGATTVRVSLGSSGAEANGPSMNPSISGDGRYVAFESNASNLVTNDTNGATDIFVRDSGPIYQTMCLGDGTGSACPCGNTGALGSGCNNSIGTGGARLAASGSTTPDLLVLHASGELPTALTIFLQGNTMTVPTVFGDGLRCIGGALKRLFVKHAAGGLVFAPDQGDPSITSRSAALGDPISPGSLRYYQTYYRDASTTFCPSPPGGSFNSSGGVIVGW